MSKNPNKKFISSAILPDGSIIEMVYREKDDNTQLVVSIGGDWKYADNIRVNEQVILYPYPATNDLIKNKVVLFPSEAKFYGSETELIGEIRSFVHRYLDISEFFEKIAPYYVLLTWVYDDFNELPYLRAIGDYGCGKTRFLQVIGSICYKPIFAGGATTTSPIFRILSEFRGTLILDEADFRFSEATADIIKILNSGFAKGIPVLRSEGKTFDVKAFNVFGPKIIATRNKYQDRALESRFLVEEMDKGTLREDIPLNLPDCFNKETEELRNKLLYWRLINHGVRHLKPELRDETLEPRLNQIIIPLLSIIEDEKTREELKSSVKDYNRQIISDRGMELEGQVMEAILKLKLNYILPEITVKSITDIFNVEAGNLKEEITYRKIGWIIRERLKLKTERTRSGYILSHGNEERIEFLEKKYGIKEELLKENKGVNDVKVEDDIPVVEEK